jgi:cell division protein FtsX
MWIHMQIIRRSVAQRPLLWIARCFGMIFLAAVLIATWWVGTSRIKDIERQASLLTLDVILMPDAESDAGSLQVQECLAALHRRPDVVSATLLDSRGVWQLFQYELGMQPGGLTDLATMPSVIQVRLKPAFATLKNAKSVRGYLLRNHRDVIDRVLIPEGAYNDNGMMADQARQARTWSMLLALSLMAAALILTALSVRRDVLLSSLNMMLGKSPHWGLAIVIGSLGLIVVLACGLALLLAIVLTTHVQTHLPWLCNASVMFEVRT